MKNTFYRRSLFVCLNLLLLPVALSFACNPWNLFQSQTAPVHTKTTQEIVGHLSHRAASDAFQDDLRNGEWFDSAGIPLFYSAWRAKPGSVRPEPSVRSAIVKYGARVACWPSSGGIWIKQANLVDMSFLGLDRWSDTPKQFNQTAEDDFCKLLKMVGAEWWELPPPFEQRKGLGKDQFACDTLETCFEPTTKFDGLIAWPESEKVACYVSMERALENGEVALNSYHNSIEMEERCGAIMSLGGKWCKCKAHCPEIEDMDWGHRDPGPHACHDAPLTMWDVNDPDNMSIL